MRLRNKSCFLKYNYSLLGNTIQQKPPIIHKPVNWYTKQVCQVISGVYSFNHGQNSNYSPKTISWEIDKKAIKLFKLHLLLYVKNCATFHHFFFFFHLSFPKVLYKSVLLSIIKVPYKSVLLSTITCLHLSLTYHTQKYFIKAFSYLAKT